MTKSAPGLRLRRIAICIAAMMSLMHQAHAFAVDGAAEERETSFIVAGARLAGTVYFPSAGEAPFPGVVYAHGSEAATRDMIGYQLGAEYFLKKGYAVLLFDKRGAGASEGAYSETPFIEQASADLQGAVRLLQDQPEVDARKVGIFGASQAGWVAPHAALQDPTIAFVISVSGPATRMVDQFAYQHAMHFDGPALSADEVEAFLLFQTELYEYLGTGVAAPDLQAHYAAAQTKTWWAHFKRWGFDETLPDAGALDSKGFSIFRKIQYDPYRSIFNASAPLLYIYGAKDRNTPVAKSLERLNEIKRLRPSLDIAVHEFADMDHVMYVRDENRQQLPVIREDILAAIDAWLAAHEFH